MQQPQLVPAAAGGELEVRERVDRVRVGGGATDVVGERAPVLAAHEG
jgi:hypothetical protein